MFRFTTVIFFVLLSVISSFQGADSAPIAERDLCSALGGAQCTTARANIIASLASTQMAVGKLAKAASGDAVTTSAVRTAQFGLKDADSGITSIALALVAGQDPPASGRQQVGDGLTIAQTALNGINSTDASVTSAMQAALSSLATTISAGNDVVSSCPGSSNSSASTGSAAPAAPSAA